MFRGAGFFFTGISLLTKSGLKRFVIIPLIINSAIFTLVFWLGLQWFDQFLNSLLPSWLSWAEFILLPLFALSYFLMVFYLFALLMNVIAAPFNGLLAEKVEHYLLGDLATQPDVSVTLVLKQIPSSIGNELGKLMYFLLRSIPLLILFLIPGVNIIAPLLWFLFSAWMLSLEYLDYPFSNHGISFKETRNLVRGKRVTCLSYGAAVTGFTMIPILNFIAMPAAVAGATALYANSFKDQSQTIIESK